MIFKNETICPKCNHKMNPTDEETKKKIHCQLCYHHYDYKQKYILFDGKDMEETRFEYEIGERITVNSHIPMMCMEKIETDDSITHYFRRGRLVFDY